MKGLAQNQETKTHPVVREQLDLSLGHVRTEAEQRKVSSHSNKKEILEWRGNEKRVEEGEWEMSADDRCEIQSRSTIPRWRQARIGEKDVEESNWKEVRRGRKMQKGRWRWQLVWNGMKVVQNGEGGIRRDRFARSTKSLCPAKGNDVKWPCMHVQMSASVFA